VCFFLGASLYGIVFNVLGLLGLISLGSSLTLTVPVLVLAYRPLRSLWPQRLEAVTRPLTQDTHATPLLASIAAAAAVSFALLFLLTRVVFIAAPDGNIWEHYLHYDRAVLASGSTGPNEVSVEKTSDLPQLHHAGCRSSMALRISSSRPVW